MSKKIDVHDTTEITEDLKNRKIWFNGIHVFSSVKVNPAETSPDSLKINVSDTAKVTSAMGSK